MRNETTHMYKESMADEVYQKLPEVLQSLEKLYATLSFKAS